MDGEPTQKAAGMNDEWLEGLDEYVDSDEELLKALDTDAQLPVTLEPDDDDYEPYAYNPEVVPPWTTALVFDVALGLEDEETILYRHGLDSGDWCHINAHPLFQRQVAEQARDINETGVSFRTKARIQAEMYLKNVDQMIAAPHTDQKVRLEAIRSMVKWADLEPKQQKEEGTGFNQVNIQINM